MAKEYCGEDYAFDFVHYAYRVKPKQWRAKKGEVYYYINSGGDIIHILEYDVDIDNDRFMFGNYFKTENQAREAHDLVQKCLLNFHDYDNKRTT